MCKVKKTITLSSHILEKAEEERNRLGLDLSGYISVLIATGSVNNNSTPQYAPFPDMALLGAMLGNANSKAEPILEYDEDEDEEKRNRIEAMMNMSFGEDDDEEDEDEDEDED